MTAKHAIQLTASEKGLEYWLARPYVGPELAPQLRNAAILLVPREGFREHAGPVFPAQTEVLLEFLKTKAPAGLGVDICIKDDEYHELALHHDELSLATIFVTSVLLPVVVDLVSEYLKTRVLTRKKGAQLRIRFLTQDTAADKTHVTAWDYEGPADTFERLMKERLSQKPSVDELDE